MPLQWESREREVFLKTCYLLRDIETIREFAKIVNKYECASRKKEKSDRRDGNKTRDRKEAQVIICRQKTQNSALCRTLAKQQTKVCHVDNKDITSDLDTGWTYN